MNRQEHLLDILIEECAEVIQRCTKAKRFGLDEVQPEQSLSNERRIIQELCDVIGTADLLMAPEPNSTWIDPALVQRKKRQVEHFLEYSKQCGTLDESAAILDAEEFAQSIGGTVIGGPAVSFKNGADEFHEIYGDGVLQNYEDVSRAARRLGVPPSFAERLPSSFLDGVNSSDRMHSPTAASVAQAEEERRIRKESVQSAVRQHLNEVRSDRRKPEAPIDMIIFCPSCHAQHIDVAQERCERLDVEEFRMNRACGLPRYHVGRCVSRPRREVESELWTNPPHKSHLCHLCGSIFRVADVPTNGVFSIKTKGEKDTHNFKDR